VTGRSPRLTARQVERILDRNGFVLISQKGSHRKWRHLQRRHQVIVPEHGNRPLPIGTLKSIMAGADLPPEEWDKP
jgi:predicted RNA binding protein YcfA (HicA-like mRNA interferase family)